MRLWPRMKRKEEKKKCPHKAERDRFESGLKRDPNDQHHDTDDVSGARVRSPMSGRSEEARAEEFHHPFSVGAKKKQNEGIQIHAYM